MKPFVKTTLRQVLNNLKNYPEITVIFLNNSKPSEKTLDMTIEDIGRYNRKKNCNVSIIIKGDNSPAKTFFENLSKNIKFH